ncbi:MAG: S1C family serine protease [Kofleriaceae bacterium]
MRRDLAVLVLLAACSGPKTGPKKPLTAKDIVALSSPAIVFVEVGEGENRQSGTGFVLHKSGLIATNFHVVRGNKQIKVKLFGGETFPVTQIAGVDPGRDLAVLRIQPGKALPTLQLGDSAAMSAGDQVIAIGNPLGIFEYSVSSGLVSQVRPICTKEMVELHNQNAARFEELIAKPSRSEQETEELQKIGCLQELTFFQISAPISQGSSGGPLFNLAGEVVGVTTLIVTAGQNINFAVPTNYLKPIMTKPEAISLEDFALKTREGRPPSATDDGQKVVRQIPNHAVALLDGCNGPQVTDLVRSIGEAISVGAPLYNAGNMEACFRIYEGTATKYATNPPCKGIKSAFDDGLSRAKLLPDHEGKPNWKLKAWAMRDTFDGLIEVAKQWAQANPGALKKP